MLAVNFISRCKIHKRFHANGWKNPKTIFFSWNTCLVAFITKSSLVRFLAHYSPFSKRRKNIFEISRHSFRNKILTNNGPFLQILQTFCKIRLLGISKYICAVLIVLLMNILKSVEMCYIPSLQPWKGMLVNIKIVYPYKSMLQIRWAILLFEFNTTRKII